VKTALVVSPHFDDAVLSAGQFLAGRPDTVVLTVLAGMPKASSVLTVYDQLSGFKSAREALEARTAENAEALALLGARPHNLGFMDSQYGKPASREGIAKCIRLAIREHDPELVIGPLGIGHPDHELVREALLDAALGLSRSLWLYEDTPTRVLRPELVPDALEALRARQMSVELGFVGDGPLAQKSAALWSYRSQLPLFENHHTLLCPERFWNVKLVVTINVQEKDL
jgi:LmbE family N-acetylglucosaminyl deacetylase